jgi:hypothetical protein
MAQGTEPGAAARMKRELREWMDTFVARHGRGELSAARSVPS